MCDVIVMGEWDGNGHRMGKAPRQDQVMPLALFFFACHCGIETYVRLGAFIVGERLQYRTVCVCVKLTDYGGGCPVFFSPGGGF